MINATRMSRALMLCMLTIGMLFCPAPSLEASWRLDPQRFYNSVHGQTGCTECHTDVPDRALHPNPAHVNKQVEDFFSADSCMICHDEIQDNLLEGTHGSESVDDPQAFQNCIDCHNPHYQQVADDDAAAAQADALQPLPEPAEEDAACVACHFKPADNDPEKKQKQAAFCFSCHDAEKKDEWQNVATVPLIDAGNYAASPHAGFECAVCHINAARFGHNRQQQGDCAQCHVPHDEKVAHDAHIGVTCRACHTEGAVPVRDAETLAVVAQSARPAGLISTVHQMRLPRDEASCRTCHFERNRVGAAAMVLPPKSLMCMPCHTATLSVGDTTTIAAFVVFVIGFGLAASLWFSGSVAGSQNGSVAANILSVMTGSLRSLVVTHKGLLGKTLFFDILLQRRLFNRSFVRWLIHSMIFLPFVLRFLFGLVALPASLWFPQSTVTAILLNKNHPFTAFWFDITGVCLLTGIVLALVRGGTTGAPGQHSGLPRQDRLALGLIGGIVLVGFVAEGMRMAMTGTPLDASAAFAGRLFALGFSGMTGLTDVYGYIWYLHAVLTGVFVAYLPFSRLMHIIMGPVVLMRRALSDHAHHTQ